MKVVVLGTRGFPQVQGGVEAHCENLYPRLVKRRCQVEAFTRSPYIAKPSPYYEGVHLIPLDCPHNKFFEAIVHTFKGILEAKRLRADILHIHAIGPSLFAPLARLLGMTVIVTNHGPDYERQKWKGFPKYFLKFCEWMGMKFADEVIVIADNISEHVRQKYGREAIVIPNGVEIPTSARLVEDTNLLETHGLEPSRYLLAVGRFVPEKGFHDLIDAFGRARLRGWKLAIAGGADHEDGYSFNLKRKARAAENVVLTGYLDKRALGQLYAHAGIFVLPSYYEGLPIVLLEAMSFGLSCLVSDIPAHSTIELPRERFFSPGDIDAMADKIRRFASTPFTRQEKTRQIELVRGKYDWEKVAYETLEVYSKAYSSRA